MQTKTKDFFFFEWQEKIKTSGKCNFLPDQLTPRKHIITIANLAWCGSYRFIYGIR
jgi:hypothetical protein